MPTCVNFLGTQRPRVGPGGIYARPVELKTKYDPANFLSFNQNVESRR
jgi:hypothetical protein